MFVGSEFAIYYIFNIMYHFILKIGVLKEETDILSFAHNSLLLT